ATFSIIVLTGVLVSLVAAAGCIKGNPATDSGDPGVPFGPSAITTHPLAYVQDVKPILDRDCLSCHRSGFRGEGDERAGGYSVSTYADVLTGQTPVDAISSLVENFIALREYVS